MSRNRKLEIHLDDYGLPVRLRLVLDRLEFSGTWTTGSYSAQDQSVGFERRVMTETMSLIAPVGTGRDCQSILLRPQRPCLTHRLIRPDSLMQHGQKTRYQSAARLQIRRWSLSFRYGRSSGPRSPGEYRLRTNSLVRWRWRGRDGPVLRRRRWNERGRRRPYRRWRIGRRAGFQF